MAKNDQILARLAIYLSANNAEMKKILNDSSKQLNSFVGTVKSAGQALGIAFGAAALFSGLKSAVGIAANFEERMSEVKAITGATGKEFQSLENDAKRLGSSTKFTAEQVASLQVAYGRLGFTTKEIREATSATLDLAAATGEDLAKSADVAGSTVRGFGLDASETQRVVDVMAASFNQTALGLDNFTEAMKYVAPIANAAGASIEETTALLGVLADAGIRGSTAGTSLRKIFTDMAKDGRPLRDRLAELAAKGITLTDAFDEVGRTAQTSLLVLTKETEKTDQLTRSFHDVAGEAKAMALVMQDNLNGSVTKLTSSWQALIIAFQNTFAIKEAIDQLTGLFNLISGAGDNIDTKLERIAKTLALPKGKINQDFIDQVKELRKELGKPIETPQVNFLIEKYALSAEKAAELNAIIIEINSSLSLQERTIADFKDLPYDKAIPAIEDYKQSLYELILQQQIERDQLGGFADRALFDKKISGYQDIIEVLAAYELSLKKKNETEVKANAKTIETIQTLEDKIKSLKDTQEKETPTGDILGLQKLEKRIDSVKLKLQLLLNKIAGVRDEIDFSALTSDPSKDPVSSLFSKANVTGGNVGTTLSQFSVPPVDAGAYIDSLKEVENKTVTFVSEMGKQFIDLGGVISGAISGFAQAIGKSIAGTEDFGDALLKAIGSFAQQFGELLIAAGVGTIALESGNPYAMIAGGAALVAIGAALSALSKKRETLISGGRSGSGSGNRGNSFDASGIEIQIGGEFRIYGPDLIAIINRQIQLNGRTSGS